jgi:hypothetical protein
MATAYLNPGATATRNRDNSASITRTYVVRSATAITETDALLATNLPQPGEAHPGNPRARVDSVQVKDLEAGKVWEATVNFSVPSGQGDFGGAEDDPEDPTTRRPEVDFGSAPYTKIVDKAYGGSDVQGNPTQPIQNSASDPFDPPIQEEVSRPVISAKYAIRRFNPAVKFELENTINASAIVFCGFQVPARRARLLSVGCSPRYDADDVLYWEMAVQVEINWDGYTRKLLDQGYYYFASGDKTEITVKDASGKDVPVTEPQMLDGAGGLSESPHFLSFDTFWAADWSALNLPREY